MSGARDTLQLLSHPNTAFPLLSQKKSAAVVGSLKKTWVLAPAFQWGRPIALSMGEP